MERYKQVTQGRQRDFMLKHQYGEWAKYADAQATVEALQAQLPVEMQECTILFKECEKGHGRLTATNWIDHGCQTCAVEALQRERDELREMTKVICGHCCEPMAIPSKAILQSHLSAVQGLVRALPDCPGEIKVYPPAVGVICGTYDVRYDFHFERGSFQSIRLAMFHDECEANTYADLLKVRATLDATPPAHEQTKATVFNEWGVALRQMADVEPKGGDGE